LPCFIRFFFELCGRCLGSADSDEGVALVACHDHVYERRLLVEMTSSGAIVRAGRCLEPTDRAVAWVPCEEGSPRQHWWLVDGRLTPVTAHRKCLTDYAGQTHHLAVLKDCTSVDGHESVVTQRWNFINF